MFLKALRAGDWVLLDELNLASQSVLEGLNACLDHRATVYIPEIDKYERAVSSLPAASSLVIIACPLCRSFECPPTFRVFAAQNPFHQGGGRKGLPKSFLNRFTKVRLAGSLYFTTLCVRPLCCVSPGVCGPSVRR